MRLAKYRLVAERSLLAFRFISHGPKGRIVKKVIFSEVNLKGVYNLSFGDLDPESGNIDDSVVSNNGDSELVLGTVVATVYAFTNVYHSAQVFATGSTTSRTRLYRIEITKYLTEIKKDFYILGLGIDGWEEFKNGIEYRAFLVTRKKPNLDI